MLFRSDGGATWSNITGATTNIYSATALVNSTYRCAVTCTPSSLTAYSANTGLVTVTGAVTYAPIPYSQSFETWANVCGIADRPNDNHWTTNPVTGNNSWKREDDASLGGSASGGNWMVATYGPATTAGSVGTHAAKF